MKWRSGELSHISGFQREVHDYLCQSQRPVLPSYHEGMSNVLMEASATGRPVLASRDQRL